MLRGGMTARQEAEQQIPHGAFVPIRNDIERNTSVYARCDVIPNRRQAAVRNLLLGFKPDSSAF